VRNAYKVLDNLKERDDLENLHVCGRLILKWILKKGVVRMLTGLIWLRIGINGGSYEHSIELRGSIKGMQFLD
jgi:hypothetical protein